MWLLLIFCSVKRVFVIITCSSCRLECKTQTPAGKARQVRPVQLWRLAPRGHKLNGPRRQKAPSRPIHLMLVGAERAASAFLTRRSAATRRLTGRPRKAKSCTEIFSGF
jgi:hypothetical protein